MEFFKRPALLGMLVFLFACKKDPPPKLDRVIIPDPSTFSSRAHYMNTAVSLEGGIDSSTLKLSLKAEIDPLVYEGATLKPGHIDIYDNLAYVSYYQEGSAYKGAVEIIDLRTKGKPKIISQAVFLDTDINSVAYYDSKVYLAEASSDIHFTYPAVLEEVKLSGGLFTASTKRVAVSSQEATSVMVADGKIYVTSSISGGLTIFDQLTMTKRREFNHRQARVLKLHKDKYSVLGVSPGKLYIYSRFDDMLVLTIDLGSASTKDLRYDLAMNDSSVYAALGEGGTSVINISTGEIKANIPPPVISGISPYKTFSESVATENNYVYVANGDAGVYVYKHEGGGMKYLGIIKFSGGLSSDYLMVENNLLFIGSASGGLKILQVTP